MKFQSYPILTVLRTHLQQSKFYLQKYVSFSGCFYFLPSLNVQTFHTLSLSMSMIVNVIDHEISMSSNTYSTGKAVVNIGPIGQFLNSSKAVFKARTKRVGPLRESHYGAHIAWIIAPRLLKFPSTSHGIYITLNFYVMYPIVHGLLKQRIKILLRPVHASIYMLLLWYHRFTNSVTPR